MCFNVPSVQPADQSSGLDMELHSAGTLSNPSSISPSSINNKLHVYHHPQDEFLFWIARIDMRPRPFLPREMFGDFLEFKTIFSQEI